jgi:threonine dehydratase
MSDLPRQRWADVAKGLCIVLVVLWHVTRKDYLQLPLDPSLPVAGAWGRFSEVLLPVRMPLFFLISGLFAARQLDRPWPRVWSDRVAPLLYLFVLWTLVHTLVLRLAPGFDTAVAHSPGELLVQLTVTRVPRRNQTRLVSRP